jgi:hypothetical protein
MQLVSIGYIMNIFSSTVFYFVGAEYQEELYQYTDIHLQSVDFNLQGLLLKP